MCKRHKWWVRFVPIVMIVYCSSIEKKFEFHKRLYKIFSRDPLLKKYRGGNKIIYRYSSRFTEVII